MKEYNDMTKLHSDFDLIYDLKYMYEVEMVCDGLSPAGTDASPEDLYEMFVDHKMEIPEYLKNAVGVKVNETEVWISIDRTWSFHEPLFDEKHKFVKTKMILDKEWLNMYKTRNGE